MPLSGWYRPTHTTPVCVCVCVEWRQKVSFFLFGRFFFGCLSRCVCHPLLTHETWRVLELYSKGGGRPIRRYPREGSGSCRNKVGATSSDSDTCFACKHIIKDQTNNMKLTSSSPKPPMQIPLHRSMRSCFDSVGVGRGYRR